MKVVALFALAIALVACGGPSSTSIRRARYLTSATDLRDTTEQVIRENFRYQVLRSGGFRVGPIWYDVEQRRIPIEQPTPPDTAAYVVILFVFVDGNEHDGFHLEIVPHASHFRDGRWEQYQTPGRPGNVFEHDSFLASPADVVFRGVHERLGDRAHHPSPKKRYPR